MTTTAIIGHGTQFSYFSIDAYVPVAEVTSISGPSMSRDAVDATHMLSEEKWREFIPGLRDPGEVTITLHFVINNEGVISSLFQDDLIRNFKISWPNAIADWIFGAYCTSAEIEAPLDDKIVVTSTFKLSGKPAFMVETP